MRIISGKFKSTKLFIPTDKSTRPLRDVVKESIFNTIAHSNKFSFHLEKKNVLDLFSGTGSFGLECLSRGVKKVTFVENNFDATKILFKNIKKVKSENPNKTEVIATSVTNFLSKINDIKSKFDLLFLDPPYKEKNIYELLDKIKKKKILNNNALIILHRDKKSDDNIPLDFHVCEEKIYGLSKIKFII